MDLAGLTPVPTRIAVCGGLMAVGGLPAPGASDPRLSGLLDGGRWLAMFGPRWLAGNGNGTDSNIFSSVQEALATSVPSKLQQSSV